jgi:hypothetical protein
MSGRLKTGFSFASLYLESVHNVDTLWTDFLKKGICAPFGYKTGANTRSVRKAAGFADRHYLSAERKTLFYFPCRNIRNYRPSAALFGPVRQVCGNFSLQALFLFVFSRFSKIQDFSTFIPDYPMRG